MLDKTNITFLSEKFLGHVCVYFIGSNDYDCNSPGSSSYRYAGGIDHCSHTTFAVTDNNNTDPAAEAVENDSSSAVAEDGSSDNNESAKSGINTTVCGPDGAHKCQTSSGEK